MKKTHRRLIAPQAAAIQIGPSTGAIAQARAAIVEIMTVDAPSEVRIEGLKTLHTLCAVTNTTITDCQFEVKP